MQSATVILMLFCFMFFKGVFFCFFCLFRFDVVCFAGTSSLIALQASAPMVISKIDI